MGEVRVARWLVRSGGRGGWKDDAMKWASAKRAIWLLFLAFCSVASRGSDWPQWRGPGRDGKSAETGLLKHWGEEGLKPLWVADGLGQGLATVAVAGGMIYATGMAKESQEGTVSVFDLSGKLKSRITYGPEWKKSYPGGRYTPTIDGGRIYLLTGFGRLVCVDGQAGSVAWSEDVAGKYGGIAPVHGFAEAPLVDGDRVICTPGGKDASLVALDKRTGRTLWTSSGLSEQSAYCSPILVERGATRQVVTILANHLVGLDVETGKLLWSHPQDSDAQDPNHAITPAYCGGVIYATSSHGKGGQLLELSPDGLQIRQKWADQTLNSNHGGVVIVDGYVYGANLKSRWVCLSLRDGEVMYATNSVKGGSITYADGMLYCYGDNGVMGLVKASAKSHELAGRMKIAHGDGPHWSHPVISGGRLYIRHGDALLAYALTAESATAVPSR